MKKRILAGLAIELLMFSATGVADTTTTVISDDFNDNTLDPAWSISMTQATGWSYIESGTSLNVTDIAATDSGWASVNLSQEFEPLSDFNVDFEFSWNSEGSYLAMQNVHVQIYTLEEAMIAYVGYSDGSFYEQGAKFGKAGGTIIDEGPDYPLPDSGSASVNINRTGNDINILWNGDLFISGTGDDLINRVDLVFSYRVYEDGELTSFFGNEAIDSINVEGTIVLPVPNILGMTETNAVDTIISAGLVVGNIDYVYDDIVPADHVVNQSPAPGTIVPYGAAVDLVISNGPTPPDLIGEFTRLRLHGLPTSDDIVRTQISVFNIGGTPTAFKQTIDIDIWLRPCDATNADQDIYVTTLYDISVSKLQPSRSKKCNVRLNLPVVLVGGGYKLFAKIDSSNDVEEFNEENNEAFSECFEIIVE